MINIQLFYHGIIIVFDPTKDWTFIEAMKQLDLVYSSGQFYSVVLVSTKADLPSTEKKVSILEAQVKADYYKTRYFETSAKSNKGIDDIFHYVVMEAVERMDKGEIRDWKKRSSKSNWKCLIF